MKKPVIYLSGPIDNCTDEECKGWRNAIKAIHEHKYKFLDPMDRDFREPGFNLKYRKLIVAMDKIDIARSDVVLVNFQRPTVGTSMEVIYAHQLGKLVVIVNSSNIEYENLSPWLFEHCVSIFPNFVKSFVFIDEFYRKSDKNLVMRYT